MPGTAFRIAASITVAPFSTSMVRVWPLWSTKFIFVMIARVAGLKRTARGCPITARSGQRQSGTAEHLLDRRARLGPRLLQCGDCLFRLAALRRNRLRRIGYGERPDRQC